MSIPKVKVIPPIPPLKCTICGKENPHNMNAEYVTYPNDYCNMAIKLDCGHWMFDDCDEVHIINGTCVKHWRYYKKAMKERRW